MDRKWTERSCQARQYCVSRVEKPHCQGGSLEFLIWRAQNWSKLLRMLTQVAGNHSGSNLPSECIRQFDAFMNTDVFFQLLFGDKKRERDSSLFCVRGEKRGWQINHVPSSFLQNGRVNQATWSNLCFLSHSKPSLRFLCPANPWENPIEPSTIVSLSFSDRHGNILVISGSLPCSGKQARMNWRHRLRTVRFVDVPLVHLVLRSLTVLGATPRSLFLLLLIARWATAYGGTPIIGTRIVHTRYGKLQGMVYPMDHSKHLKPVEVFLGIPYATPPILSNRFSPTRTPSPWEGIRVADKLAPVCPQNLPGKWNFPLIECL